jgi:hypothetical protein
MSKFSLKKLIRNWLNNDDDSTYLNLVKEPSRLEARGNELESDPIRLQIYIASGGKIVETKVYNKHRDSIDVQLYVITDDQDLGHELSKIITMTGLRS